MNQRLLHEQAFEQRRCVVGVLAKGFSANSEIEHGPVVPAPGDFFKGEGGIVPQRKVFSGYCGGPTPRVYPEQREMQGSGGRDPYVTSGVRICSAENQGQITVPEFAAIPENIASA